MPRRRRRHGWIKPLLNISCQFAAGDYPMTVKILFENGVSRRYRDDEINQPPPATYFQKMQSPVVGYQYGKRKDRIHRSEL